MTDARLSQLARDLRVTPADVSYLSAVDDATLGSLHEALRLAHRRQEESLLRAFDGTIKLVPKPLRSRVRRLLTGT